MTDKMDRYDYAVNVHLHLQPQVLPDAIEKLVKC